MLCYNEKSNEKNLRPSKTVLKLEVRESCNPLYNPG